VYPRIRPEHKLDLAAVADAIGEGRRVYDNIRRVLRYALSGGIAELIVTVVR
jgi:P-type Ca2+ transporter type 2C